MFPFLVDMKAIVVLLTNWQTFNYPEFRSCLLYFESLKMSPPWETKSWVLAIFLKKKSRILMKEKSIHQFNVKFIFTVLKACYVLKMTVIKATTIRPPKYLGSILI